MLHPSPVNVVAKGRVKHSLKELDKLQHFSGRGDAVNKATTKYKKAMSNIEITKKKRKQ